MDPRPILYLVLVAAIFGGGWKLRDYQADRAELLVLKVKEEARQGAAEAIAGIEYDQLILEFGSWTHISVPEVTSPARGDQLTYRAGKPVERGIVA